MQIFENTYFQIYLIGCIFAILSQLIAAIFYFFLSFITKENILNKNLKKINEPDTTSKTQKLIKTIITTMIGALSSWINVIGIWITFFITILNIIRAWFQFTPESIKELRFPLYNNPNLSQEAVWAYTYAIMIKAGERTQNRHDIINSIYLINEYCPTFNKKSALQILFSLHVLENNIIEEILVDL